MAQDAQTILNEVPKQSAGTSMKDLQFDPSTGEFRQVPRGTDPGPTGNVVTEMTDQGFAAELPLVYLDKQELVDFFESGATRLNGVAYEWEGEQVVHLHTHPTRHAHGKVSMAAFLRSGVAPHSTPTDATYSVTVDMPNADTLTIEVNDAQGNIIDNVNFIPSRDELYSRAKGILERDILAPTTVTIVGLGSFGSQIAIELAKAGVGRFKLMDFDRVELHNLARHTCTAAELGRLKTDAIADAIWGKNPYAVVERYPIDVNEHLDTLEQAVRDSQVVIVATDNNTSRFNIQQALIRQGRMGIFGRAITRAEGGDVFRYQPGGPCYCCLVGNQSFGALEEITSVASARRSGAIPAYASAQEADAMVQVGLSSDIEPMCNLMVKLALVELARGSNSGIASLEQELVYDYYMWANRRERRYANWHAMPGAGAQPTILRWYGAHIEREQGCAVCGSSQQLDTGDDYIPLLPDNNYDNLTLE